MKSFFLKIIWTILRAEAKLVLLVKRPKIIAVTGSVAKTTTKDAIYWVLKDSFNVWKSPGNLNTEIGLPLTVLGYKKDHSPNKILLPYFLLWGFFKSIILLFSSYPELLILEMGVEAKGDMKYLLKFAKPNVSVVTCIGPVHLEFFDNIEGVYNEKADIVRVLKPEDWVVLNKSDAYTAKMAKETKAKVKYFESETIDIFKNAAKAVGEIFAISDKNIEDRLKTLKASKQRLNIFEIKGIKIIDDTYNSNPVSTKASLENLAKMSGKKKIAVLGDMLELGSFEKEGHRQIGELAGKVCDTIIFVGERSKLFKAGINKSSSAEVCEAKNIDDAKEKLSETMKSGDVVLVKGSRRIGLENLVKKLINK